jgi:hypothetical protein
MVLSRSIWINGKAAVLCFFTVSQSVSQARLEQL